MTTKIPTPTLQEMGARLVIAVLVVGAFVSLGMWASSTNVFTWLATAVAAGVALTISGTLRNASLKNLEASRFSSVINVIREHPLLNRLVTDRAARAVVAIGFGVLVASLESVVASTLLAGLTWPDLAKGLLSISIVLLPTWTAVGMLVAPNPKSWGARMIRELTSATGLGKLGDANRFLRALGVALLRTSGTVIGRTALVLVLPMIFESIWATIFLAITAVTLITAGDFIAGVLKAFGGSVRPPAAREDDRTDVEAPAATNTAEATTTTTTNPTEGDNR